jgi:rSAM/selenodomain-associated transferase 1
MGAKDCCLVVFAKPARPGLVKTRLSGVLSAERAASLQGVFLEDLVERLEGGEFDIRIAWAVAADEPLPPSSLPGFRQVEGDLGERLFAGLSQALARYRRVAAIGSDHPELPVSIVEQGFEELVSGRDVALGPTTDGGYYMIALTRDSIHRELFSDIDWSTDRVFGQTLERCRRLHLSVEELAPLDDVDTPEDLCRLIERLAEGQGPASPRTQRLLAEWGMIPETGRAE